jgi:hypothetical protein
LPAPLLFNLDGRNGWSLIKGELDAYIEEHPQPVHGDGEATEDSVQLSNTWEFPYQQSYIMIMHHLLHLHESQITVMPMMTHQLGAITGAGIDLHLGQKPKLGGRYTDDSLIYISYFVSILYIHVLLSFLLFVILVLISTFQNTKRPKIFPLFLFVCLFSSLALVCFVSYFRFGI